MTEIVLIDKVKDQNILKEWIKIAVNQSFDNGIPTIKSEADILNTLIGPKYKITTDLCDQKEVIAIICGIIERQFSIARCIDHGFFRRSDLELFLK